LKTIITMTNNSTICSRIELEKYNNNDQQFNRHAGFLIKSRLII